MTRDQLSTTNNVAELKRNNIILATIDATRQVTTTLKCKCGFSATGLFSRSVDKAIKCRYVIDDSDAPIHPEGRKTKRKTASELNIVSEMEKKKRKRTELGEDFDENKSNLKPKSKKSNKETKNTNKRRQTKQQQQQYETQQDQSNSDYIEDSKPTKKSIRSKSVQTNKTVQAQQSKNLITKEIKPQTVGQIHLASPTQNRILNSPTEKSMIKSIVSIANSKRKSNLKQSIYEYSLDDLILDDEDSDDYKFISDDDEITDTSLTSQHITINSLKRIRRE
ncbi:MAG: hypothetical protein EZS28_011547 [Streblomastix strix]|uniref:Uncharacterized protein n=1 Tax=Streblomastix strix TaxID=222440 RepID=A0A5J4WDC6_9EUKA|nr:MAG: hypothetical protein EZS28_011547 [Streblomastix strix]